MNNPPFSFASFCARKLRFAPTMIEDVTFIVGKILTNEGMPYIVHALTPTAKQLCMDGCFDEASILERLKPIIQQGGHDKLRHRIVNVLDAHYRSTGFSGTDSLKLATAHVRVLEPHLTDLHNAYPLLDAVVEIMRKKGVFWLSPVDTRLWLRIHVWLRQYVLPLHLGTEEEDALVAKCIEALVPHHSVLSAAEDFDTCIKELFNTVILNSTKDESNPSMYSPNELLCPYVNPNRECDPNILKVVKEVFEEHGVELEDAMLFNTVDIFTHRKIRESQIRVEILTHICSSHHGPYATEARIRYVVKKFLIRSFGKSYDYKPLIDRFLSNEPGVGTGKNIAELHAKHNFISKVETAFEAWLAATRFHHTLIDWAIDYAALFSARVPLTPAAALRFNADALLIVKAIMKYESYPPHENKVADLTSAFWKAKRGLDRGMFDVDMFVHQKLGITEKSKDNPMNSVVIPNNQAAFTCMRGDDQLVISREWGISPGNNPFYGAWVIRNMQTGEYIDHDRYRSDLFERNHLKEELVK